MRLYREVWKSLAKHYLVVWQTVWEKRHFLSHPERGDDERAFLPAALELQETPVSPLPRVAMWVICGAAGFFLLWALLGKLDVVATAQGKIIPSDRTKVIQAMETALVKAIHVKDGQTVEANALLLELDPTVAQADQTRAYADYTAVRLARARAQVFLENLDNPNRGDARLANSRTKPLLEAIPQERIVAEEKILAAQFREYQMNLEQHEAEIARREATYTSARERTEQLQETLPIIQATALDYKNLYEKDYVSKHDYWEKKKQKITVEHELAAEAGRLAELYSGLKESQHARESWRAEVRKTAQETLGQLETKSIESNQEHIKAEQHVRQLELRSPVAGKVQQLAVHTIGGVVTPAQPLLVIVPGKESVEIEAWIQNKDIGFVSEGQEAVVKVEAFPYTKYGMVPGRVKNISLDAVTDEKQGLVYACRVQMLRQVMAVENKKVPLSPGMAVAVEIKTGKRRVMEYFLSPLLTQAGDSLKER
jgi:hemolysin D